MVFIAVRTDPGGCSDGAFIVAATLQRAKRVGAACAVELRMLRRALTLRLRSLSGQELLQRAVLVAIVLASVVAISPNVADPDLWGHVQYGRDLLSHGLPEKTTYSYLAQDQAWINHENLMEIALALGAIYLGPLGLVAAKMLAGLALLLVVLHTCRKQQAGLLATAIVLLLTANGVAHYWSLRPQLFSFVAYAAMLWLLEWCFASWGTRDWGPGTGKRDSRSPIPGPQSLVPSRAFHLRLSWLWLMFPLMVAWTNAHGGFLVGCAVFTTYLLVRSAEAYWQVGWRAIGTIKRFAVWIGATLLATFFNPYGYDFHLWLLDDLKVPRPEITEWLPPSWTDPQSIPLLCLVALFAATIVLSRHKWDSAHLLILAATLWQSLAHQRHIPFFALSVAFFLPGHVESVVARLKEQRTEGKGQTKSKRVFPFALCPFPLALAFALLGWKLYERASDLKVHRYAYPVSALQYVADYDLRGRVLCTFNWAQYALAAFDDRRLQVHIDGRCRTAFSQAMLDEHFDFLFGDEPASKRYRDPSSSFDPSKALEHGQPNLVLIDRGQSHSVAVMEAESRRWVLLYQDSLAQLWGRRERYDDPQSPDYLPVEQRCIGNEAQEGHATWPALPKIARSDSRNRLARADAERQWTILSYFENQ
jgi:hypothetical protein